MTRFVYTLLLMMLSSLASTATGAELWTDVTRRFVVNPDFAGDSSEGWTWVSNATTQQVRVECISFFNGSFDMHQQLNSLPKGHYRLTVQGFYRQTNNTESYQAYTAGNERLTAVLYAGSSAKTLVSAFSAAMSDDPGRSFSPDATHYYPDGKEAALAAFSQGLYTNALEFDAEGSVQIGVRCNEYLSDNYCVLDNFRLEYATPADAEGKAWIDVTDLMLKNPGFNLNSQEGWQWESDASSQTARMNCMEFWNGNFDLWQQVTGAPQGKYRLSVQAYYRVTDNDWGYYLHTTGQESGMATLYAGNNSQPLVSVYSESYPQALNGGWSQDGHHFPNSMEAGRMCFDANMYWNTMEFEAEGDFRVGLKSEEAWGGNWCLFDNFRLEYYGRVVAPEAIVLSADRTELVRGEKLTVEATVKPLGAIVAWIEWTSSNERVATVSQDGTVTALGQGTATITATTSDGSGVKGSLTVTVSSNPATPGALVITEIMASNVDEFISPAFNFDGWIELHNTTDRPVELGGLRVSDPTNGLGPWQMPPVMGVVPPNGYQVVWFDSNNIAPQNAPFKLDTDGGTVVVSSADGREIARQSYPASLERISYAQNSDGQWGHCAEPTPGADNGTFATASSQIAAPVVDQPSRLFQGQLSVNVTIPGGCTLRYTTDGTLPTMKNGQTSRTGQFKVTDTSIYRFRLYSSDMLPSRVTTRSYIYKDNDYYLPVVSVVADPDFLYSREIGVFMQGPNGRPGNGLSAKCNWNMDWERPVNFSYLTPDGEMVLNQDVNLEMCGGWSRAWSPRAFKLKGNKEMGGDKNLPYPFFSQKPYIRNRTLQIRNGGNDNNARIKDPALQVIIQSAGMNLDCQSYQPVHEFINGSYVGVLNVREPNNKHYVYANYGWDDDEIDQFEMSPDSGYVQKCGTPDAFNELVDVLSPNAANGDTYAEIGRVLDIDAFINYMAAQLFLGNWDWPQNNVKAFRHRDGGRFRFVLFDLDGSFSTDNGFNNFFGKEYYTFDELYPRTLKRHVNEQIRLVTLFKNLLQNEDFRHRFINAYCIMGGSVYQKTRATKIIDELSSNVQPAMDMEWASWALNNTVNDLKNKLNSRLSSASTTLRNYSLFGLRNTTRQTVTLSADTEGARLFIGDEEVPTAHFEGHLFAPVRLKALAPAGYEFKGWANAQGSILYTDADIALPTGTVNLKATFTPMSNSRKAAEGITPVRINEVSGSNDSFVDEYGKKGDWVELYNTTDRQVDVEGMYLTDDPANPTKYQITKGDTRANTLIAPHGYLIVWCDKRATTDAGLHASFKIDAGGGHMLLTAADRSWTDVMKYDAHDARTTIGRYPDGTADVYAMNVVTIGQRNLMTSYATRVEQQGGDVAVRPLSSAANGLRLCYASQMLLVKSEDSPEVSVTIYHTDGTPACQARLSVRGGTARLSTASLAPGLYVARATDEGGNAVSCKFTVSR